MQCVRSRAGGRHSGNGGNPTATGSLPPPTGVFLSSEAGRLLAGDPGHPSPGPGDGSSCPSLQAFEHCPPLPLPPGLPSGVSPRPFPRCPHFLSRGRAGSGLLGHRGDRALSCKQSQVPLPPGLPHVRQRDCRPCLPCLACPMPGTSSPLGRPLPWDSWPTSCPLCSPCGCVWGCASGGPGSGLRGPARPRRAHVRLASPSLGLETVLLTLWMKKAVPEGLSRDGGGAGVAL